MRRFSNADTGWRFECPIQADGKPPPGGLVLQNVRHEDHNFARDIRLIALWIDIEHVDAGGQVVRSEKRVRTLDPRMGFAPSDVREIIPYGMACPKLSPEVAALTGSEPVKVFRRLKEVDDALYFRNYFQDETKNHLAYGVAATHSAPVLFTSVLGLPNCTQAGLEIEQVYLFSRYSTQPNHEPSGNLGAARCHPFVHYRFLKNTAFVSPGPHSRVKSIRFDYRLHLLLDRHHDLGKNATLQQFNNAAGLFADRDSAAKVAFKTAIDFKRRMSISRAAFRAVEKPLLLEVIGPGLVKGFPSVSYLPAAERPQEKFTACWDNLHWWGNLIVDGGTSTPGAFHAAHLHWRWGAAISIITQSPPFNPDTWPSSLQTSSFGPLVDPGVFLQSIWVAVVLDDQRLSPSTQPLLSLTEETWTSLFDPGLGRKPEKLLRNKPIVLWYSTEVHTSVNYSAETIYTSALEGTVFLHGIFFAHDAEPDPSYFQISLGDAGSQHWPRLSHMVEKDRKWLRAAE